MPIGCAPGNGPDLIFEFENYVLVAEVTLTDSSRQEAAEGEPVRRHVAELLKRLNKTEFRAFQASQRGGEIICRLVGDRVELEGSCVFYLEGEVEI